MGSQSPPPPASGTKPFLWILVIVLGLLFLAGIGVIGTGLWVARRVHHAVSDGKSGGIELHTKDGDVRLGRGANAKIPYWAPIYPGAKPMMNFSAEGEKGEGGSYGFLTDDAPARVTAYYRAALSAEGMEITEEPDRITGRNTRVNRTVTVMVGAHSGKTAITVVFGENRE